MKNHVLPRHLLAIEGQPPEFLLDILTRAEKFIKAPESNPCLKNKTVVNLFFEPSTRTRFSFELAAKRLGAYVINFETDKSSLQKGENLLDTLHNLEMMQVDFFIIRHKENDIITNLAAKLRSNAQIINAGNGTQEHPTQALADLLTIKQYKPDFSSLSVAILGDIRHSRVAHSDIYALNILGVKDIRLIAPSEFLPLRKLPNCVNFANIDEGLKNVDVIITLRIQKERLTGELDLSTADYFAEFGLTSTRLQKANKNAIVMHPGPLNREVEIASEVADGAQSVILTQVSNGLAVRMAVMETLS